MMRNRFLHLYKKELIIFTICVLCIVLLHFLQQAPHTIETIYSNYGYPAIGYIQRACWGWIPWSMGDILYAITTIGIVIYIPYSIVQCIKKKWHYQQIVRAILKITNTLCIVYIAFLFLWGLNYNRLGITYQLHLKKSSSYSQQELIDLSTDIIAHLNTLRNEKNDTLLYAPPSFKKFKKLLVLAYQTAHKTFPFLSYHIESIKKDLFYPLADYFGYSGYFIPFTGEAQIRYNMPPITLPYTALHEMSHQLGYASESEANFIAFLVATHSNNNYFMYSTYLELFRYALHSLGNHSQRLQLYKALDTLVKEDYKKLDRFYFAHQNPIGNWMMNDFYNQYLKANNQQTGIQSYDEVIAWIIAYKKQYKAY